MKDIGSLLVFVGFLMILLGGLLLFSDKIPFLGKLPGDILIKKKNFTFYFPITTLIILSIILSIIFKIFIKK